MCSNEVLEKVRPKYDGERAELLELKRAHKERRGEPFDGKLHPWDVPFYLVRPFSFIFFYLLYIGRAARVGWQV